jgi:hypothetical protein
MEKSDIFKNYVSGWFWVDICATIDWSVIIAAFDLPTGARPPPGLRRIRAESPACRVSVRPQP